MKQSLEYIKSDYFRYKGQHASVVMMFLYTFKNHCFRFSFWYRLSKDKTVLGYFARIIRSMMASRYALYISRKAEIGYGLYIGHGYGIVISPMAHIGNNCNLSQFTTIGANDGEAARIGDNVYISPSVCLVENVNVGNNVTIGAGSVVTKDLPDNATCAGVPAKVLNFNAPGRYINNKWQMI